MNNDIFSVLKNNDLIVTENCYKLDLLNKLNKKKELINLKFITKKDLISKYYFSYDEKAVYYLIEKYKINESIAHIYLDSLYYIDNEEYNNEKLDNLVKIKEDLIKNNLLIFDDLFLDYIKTKRIVFYNYNYFTKLELSIIEKLKEITEVIIIDKKYDKNTLKVYEFDSIFEEVSFVADSVLKLIEEGISPDRIKITNLDDDYKRIIDFIFPLYSIKTNINEDYLISNKIAKEFLERACSIEEEIDLLTDKYPNSEVLNQIIKIVNKYIIFDNKKIINEMITNEFKKVKIEQKKYIGSIEEIDYQNYPITDEYVFMLGFNQKSIPKQYKDEEYITDNIKEGLLLDSTVEKNKIEKEVTISNILNIKNLTISYKLNTPFEVYFPSSLIKDLELEVITNYKPDSIYSLDYSSLELAKLLDNFILYGSVPDSLKEYSSSINISYNTYNNKYKGIDKDKFLSSIKDGFNFSYSKMNDYYKCSFKYYLSNILKVNIYEDNFAAYIGSMFHYVLEKGLLSDITVSTLVEEFISNNERDLTKKERFLIDNIVPDIEYTLNNIKDNLNKTNLDKILFEEEVEIIKNKKVKVTFKGIIDKVMYKEEKGRTILAIIDYKTGSTDINLKYVPFGLSMQLPVYLYLSNNIKEINNPTIGGFYLQKVLPANPVISLEKTIEKQKNENLLLNGYSNSDKDILKEVDNTYVNSNMIKSLGLKKDGDFYSYSKVLDNEQINKLINITNQKIEEAIDSICDAKFDINPKNDNDKNLSCQYCDYKDICFKTKKDEISINPDTKLSFLGGDLDA